jgi:Cdc6-like AAA superfamily ATPase
MLQKTESSSSGNDQTENFTEESTVSANTPLNQQIKRYNLLRRITQILFSLLLLSGVIYFVYSSINDHNSLKSIKLEDQVVSSPDGKIVVLSIIKDSSRSVLVSTDSGNNFIISGGPWIVKDSSAELLITPDSKAIILTDGTDNYYISENPFTGFTKYNIESSSPTNTQYQIEGAYYIASSQKVYLYGSMPYIISFNLNTPSHFTKIPLHLQNYTVKSLAINKRLPSYAKVLAKNNKTGKTILWDANLNDTVSSNNRYISSDTSLVDSTFIDIEHAKSIVYDSTNDHWLVITSDTTCRVFRIGKNNFYTVKNIDSALTIIAKQYNLTNVSAREKFGNDSSFKSKVLALATQFSNYNDTGLYASPTRIIANNAIINESEYKVYFYGNSKYIESTDTFMYASSGSLYERYRNIDSINPAQQIKSIALANNNPSLAVIKNNSFNYLFKKSDNQWNINPIIIDNLQQLNSNLIKIILLTIIVLFIVCIIYFITRLRVANNNIQQVIGKPAGAIENALLTKSEKPIGLQNQDLLGFEELENAVVSIIKNPQTELPLSIVINGSWGSGKTSMMNRIKERLEKDNEKSERFITTWFNVWHLQEENSLLSTFLLNIIDAYERDYTSVFRLQLAIKRFVKLPAMKQMGFGFAVAIIGSLLLLIIFSLFPSLQTWSLMPDLIIYYYFQLQNFYDGIILTDFFKKNNTLITIIIAVFSYIFLNRQFMPSGLSAFFELLPKNNFSFDVEKSPPGYREKFKKDYWEIVDVGKQGKRLVVFIDDIDRISGDKIRELLEGINFISDIASRPADVSSKAPNTVFVLGMYMSEVAKNLGAQLEKINGSEVHDEKKAITLGNRYLDKMVQLVVPVPFDKKNKQLNYLYENK